MNKILSFLLALSMICLSACGQTGVSPSDDTNAAVSEIATSEMENQTEERQLTEEFDFENKTVMLNSGYEMPIIGLDYIDLMLVHQPGAGENELYLAMQQAVYDGKVHSIGTSNYYTPEDFERVIENAEIMPAVLQNEYHPYYQNEQMPEYVSQYGTVMESYYPFGGRGHTQDIFNDETIVAIAEAHNRTSAQILVRWHLQTGYVVIPGSSNPNHIAENYDIFDFELSEEELSQIADLNRNERYGDW